MDTNFSNVYEDTQRAEAYAGLEFPGTYYLAYRDLPEIINKHVQGKKALDFGCGTGRSTRFLENLGFESVGADISKDMINMAHRLDHKGNYVIIDEGDLRRFKDNIFDLVLSVFTFDNIPTTDSKVKCFREMNRVLKEDGRIVNLVSSPLIYLHQWASFSTKEFPENKNARNGDKVKIIMTDVEDQRPIEDVLWTDEGYREVYQRAGLLIENIYKPLGKADENIRWINETEISPWVIYVLRKK